MTAPLLNPYQKNSIEVTLRSFEDDLHQVNDWLAETQTSRVLSKRQSRLSEKQKGTMRQIIQQALAEIAVLKDELYLVTEDVNVSDLIRGQMSIDWENLSGLQVKKLARYGKVSQEAAPAIDPHIGYLTNLALSLIAITDEDPTESQSQQRNS